MFHAVAPTSASGEPTGGVAYVGKLYPTPHTIVVVFVANSSKDESYF